jgi:hypothetical protein
MHRLSTTTTDFDSLLRYTLLEVSRTTGDFDLLLDCSSFEDRNAAPPDVIELLLALAPTDAMERLRRVYIFSPTCAFLHFGRKLAAVTSCKFSLILLSSTLLTVAPDNEHFRSLTSREAHSLYPRRT